MEAFESSNQIVGAFESSNQIVEAFESNIQIVGAFENIQKSAINIVEAFV